MRARGRDVVYDQGVLTETVETLVRALGLVPHPEGGFYKETYRARAMIPKPVLGDRFGGDRAVSTAIYYLLRLGDFSAFHRIESDEIWHFYGGASLTVHCLHADGSHEPIRLGDDFARGEVPQAVVPAGTIFGARIEGDGEYTLVGCTVSPGFDFAEFTLIDRNTLLASHPAHANLIDDLTRG